MGIGIFFVKFWSFLTSVVLARLLGTAQFGIYGIIIIAYSTFGVFAGLALAVTVGKFFSDFHKSDKQRAADIVSLALIASICSGILTCILLLLFRDIIAINVLMCPQLSNEIGKIGITLLFFAISGVFSGILLGAENFKLAAIVMIITGLLDFLSKSLGAWYGGIPGVVWGMIIGGALSVLFYCLASLKILRTYKISLQFGRIFKEIKILKEFTCPALLDGIFVWGGMFVVRVILFRSVDGEIQTGYLTACMQLAIVILFLPQMLSRVLLPIMSTTVASGNYGTIRNAIFTTFISFVLLALPIAIGVAIFSPWLMSLFGKDFGPHYNVLLIIALDTFLLSCFTFFPSLMQSFKLPWVSFSCQLLFFAIYIALSFALLKYQAFGIGLAGAIARFIYCIFASLSIIWLLHKKRNTIQVHE